MQNLLALNKTVIPQRKNMSTNATEEILPRQLEAGQLAVAGVAIAVISMILEFIALSGFAPSVSTLFSELRLRLSKSFSWPIFGDVFLVFGQLNKDIFLFRRSEKMTHTCCRGMMQLDKKSIILNDTYFNKNGLFSVK